MSSQARKDEGNLLSWRHFTIQCSFNTPLKAEEEEGSVKIYISFGFDMIT